MANPTRTTIWSDNQVLTASALNGEFNHLLDSLQIADADIAGGASISTSKINATFPASKILVGTTDAQAVTNKTFDSTNTFPNTLNFNTSGPQASFTTSSTSLIDVTGATITINPTKTVTVNVVISGRWWNTKQGQDSWIALIIDGVIIQQYSMRSTALDGTNFESSFCVSGQASVATGSRVIKLQAKVTSGAATIGIDQANVSMVWG